MAYQDLFELVRRDILTEQHTANFRDFLAANPHIYLQAVDSQGQTLLSLACEKGHLFFIELLLLHPHAKLNTRDKNNKFPLDYVVEHLASEIQKYKELLIPDNSLKVKAEKWITLFENLQNREAVEIAKALGRIVPRCEELLQAFPTETGQLLWTIAKPDRIIRASDICCFIYSRTVGQQQNLSEINSEIRAQRPTKNVTPLDIILEQLNEEIALNHKKFLGPACLFNAYELISVIKKYGEFNLVEINNFKQSAHLTIRNKWKEKFSNTLFCVVLLPPLLVVGLMGIFTGLEFEATYKVILVALSTFLAAFIVALCIWKLILEVTISVTTFCSYERVLVKQIITAGAINHEPSTQTCFIPLFGGRRQRRRGDIENQLEEDPLLGEGPSNYRSSRNV